MEHDFTRLGSKQRSTESLPRRASASKGSTAGDESVVREASAGALWGRFVSRDGRGGDYSPSGGPRIAKQADARRGAAWPLEHATQCSIRARGARVLTGYASV